MAADLANRLRDFNVGVTPTERKLTGLLWAWQIANRTRLDQVALKLAQRQRGREGWNFRRCVPKSAESDTKWNFGGGRREKVQKVILKCKSSGELAKCQ